MIARLWYGVTVASKAQESSVIQFSAPALGGFLPPPEETA